MRNDFSQQFNSVLEGAQAEAERFRSPMIVSEHFLLGALRDSSGTVVKILRQLNIDTDQLIKEFENHLIENIPSWFIRKPTSA